MPKNPITIIGGGVIGLSIAWQLALRGKKVAVYEKNSVGSGATGAAAGMITPTSEIRFGEEELLKLFLESTSRYPSFIRELEKVSGHSTDFQTSGSLMVAIDHDDEAELERLFDYQKELGLEVNRLTPTEVREKEPLLSHQCVGGIFSASEYFLDARRLVESLKKALSAMNVPIFEGKKVESLEIQNGRVTSIQVGDEKIKMEQVIIASGIDQKVDGLPEELFFPIRPVKGQCVELQAPPSLRLIHAVRTLHRYPVYLVPRSDGRLTIGATLEEMGHDTTVTAGSLLDLIYGAWKIFPSVTEMPVVQSWAGLRPASSDHKPILGPTSVNGLYVAMGMYRHGILLAPIVGELMAELVGEEKNSPFFEIFGSKRFQPKYEHAANCQ